MSVLIVNSMSCDMLWQFDAVFFFFFFFSPSGKAESRTPNSQHYIFIYKTLHKTLFSTQILLAMITASFLKDCQSLSSFKYKTKTFISQGPLTLALAKGYSRPRKCSPHRSLNLHIYAEVQPATFNNNHVSFHMLLP